MDRSYYKRLLQVVTYFLVITIFGTASAAFLTIRVSPLSGDNASSSAKAHITQLLKNDPILKGSVNVGEFNDQEVLVVVSGEITPSKDGEMFRPKVTVRKVKEAGHYAISLPIGFINDKAEPAFFPHQKTTLLSEQPLKQPAVFLNFLHVLVLLEKEQWQSAALKLTDLMEAYRADQNWVEYANLKQTIAFCYKQTNDIASLRKGIAFLQESAEFFHNEKKTAQYGIIQNDLAITHQMLAALRAEPDQNLNFSINAFNEAIKAGKSSSDPSTDIAIAQNNLGLSYQALAFFGVRPAENLVFAMNILKEAETALEKHKNKEIVIMTQYNLGMTYQLLSSWNIDPIPNLKKSIERFKNTADLLKDQKNYAMAQSSLGVSYQALASWGESPEENLKLAIALLVEAARVLKEQQNNIGYPATSANLGLGYQALAKRSIDSAVNFGHSIVPLEEAATIWKAQNNKAGFSMAKNNLGVSYLALADSNIEPEKNKKLSEASFKEAQAKPQEKLQEKPAVSK